MNPTKAKRPRKDRLAISNGWLSRKIKKSNKTDNRVTVRLSKGELQALKVLAIRYRVTPAHYLRSLLVNKRWELATQDEAPTAEIKALETMARELYESPGK